VALSRKHEQIICYKNLKAHNDSSIRALIGDNRSMVKRFQSELRHMLKGRAALLEEATQVPGHAAQLQDGPATELGVFVRLPLNVLLRTPDHRLVGDIPLVRLRTRCDGLQKTLKALDLAPYVTGPDVVEAVAKMKVGIGDVEERVALCEGILQEEAHLLENHHAQNKVIRKALDTCQQNMAAWRPQLERWGKVAGDMKTSNVQRIEERLQDFEMQPALQI